MVFGMDMTFSLTTADKSGETPGGHYAQNAIWPPLKTERAITLLIIGAEPTVTPLFLGFFWVKKFIAGVIL